MDDPLQVAADDFQAPETVPSPSGGFAEVWRVDAGGGERPADDAPACPTSGRGLTRKETFRATVLEDSSKRAALRKATTSSVRFLQNSDTVTRQQMVEYLSLQRWSREGCLAALLTLCLWLVLLAAISLRFHVEASFAMNQAVQWHIGNLTADPAHGLLPATVAQASGRNVTACSCACAPDAGVLCGSPRPGLLQFGGSLSSANLQLLRGRNDYLSGRGASPITQKRLGELETIPEVWSWIQHALIPDLWSEDGQRSPVVVADVFPGTVSGAPGASAGRPGSLLRWSQIIGGLRMRQRRLVEADCPLDSEVAARFAAKCHGAELSVRPFGPGASSLSVGFAPKDTDKTAFDVFLDTDRPVSIALEKVQYGLKAYNWLDSATTSLQLQAAMFNAEATPPLLELLEVRLDFQRGGSLDTSIRLRSAAAIEYPSLLIALVDVLWAMLVLRVMGKQFLKVLVRFCSLGPAPDRARFQVWDVLDWMVLVMSFAAAAIAYSIATETAGITDAIVNLPAVPPAGASDQVVTDYQNAWSTIIDRVETLVSHREFQRLFMFWYLMITSLLFLQVIRGQPKLAQLAVTIGHAAEDLIHFLLIFITMIITFALIGFMIFGSALDAWSTPAKAVNTAFQALGGDIELTRMFDVAPGSTTVWCFFFVLCMIFLMMNLLLAITLDHYNTVKAHAGNVQGILSQLRDLLRDQASRFSAMQWRYRLTCCCRRDPDVPAHDVLMEDLMGRAGFTPAARRALQTTVLAPKWNRKVRERAIFAGQVGDEAAEASVLGFQPVQKDLDQLGVHPDYAEALLESCHEQVKLNYEPEETKLAQLRELVRMAEENIVGMRERLDLCQDITKASMKDFSGRLDLLERMIHASLADVVVVAGAAGVRSSEAPVPLSAAKKARIKHSMQTLRSMSIVDEDSAEPPPMDLVLEHLGQAPLAEGASPSGSTRRSPTQAGELLSARSSTKASDLLSARTSSKAVSVASLARSATSRVVKRQPYQPPR